MPYVKVTSGGPLARGPTSQRGGALAPSTSPGILGRGGPGTIQGSRGTTMTGMAEAREADETAAVQTATARGPSGRDLLVTV
eukprot:692537-Pyramimonas_sp.AAC.1